MLMARSYPRPAASRPLVHLPHIVHRERVIRSDQQPALGLRLGLLDLALLHYQSPVGERIAIVRCPVVPRLLRELAALLVVLVAPTRKPIASFLRPLRRHPPPPRLGRYQKAPKPIASGLDPLLQPVAPLLGVHPRVLVEVHDAIAAHARLPEEPRASIAPPYVARNLNRRTLDVVLVLVRDPPVPLSPRNPSAQDRANVRGLKTHHVLLLEHALPVLLAVGLNQLQPDPL